MNTNEGPELILVRDLTALGRDPRSTQRASRSRALTRVRRGAYADARAWATATNSERHRLFVLSTMAGMRTPPVLSHESAAVLLGIPLMGPPPEKVHVAGDSASGGRSSACIQRHVVRPMPAITLVDGVAVTSAARTVVDLARSRPFTAGLVAADYVLRVGLVARAHLDEALDEVAGQRGARRARAVIDRADARAESVGESLSRAQMHLLGVPIPELQHVFYDADGFIGRTDFWWVEERKVGEFDGRIKYQPPERSGGLPPEKVVWREKRREDRLRRQIEGVVRWVWTEALNTSGFGRLLAGAGIYPVRPGVRP
ncbi:hypothetical protein FE374_04700 [Georgenia yuyongxinii]|uniref:Transcriptional regulator, AbiEi antitoxin, Type IV TA system n=1 Tax=Georgenia yuyongxinii TaxID=2589797 RepID=A0A5B8C0E8_9MICO|nr:hypothetical protein [Georgenia yuyongxinii]QDC24023.1 hypothetical protein FE374_04700 [Georgenia yuyongxinii]